MAYDLQTLTADVTDLIQEMVNLPDYSAADITRFINRGYYDYVRRTKCISAILDIPTVANQVSYDSSDLANLASVYSVYEVRYIEDDEDSEWGDLLEPLPGGPSGRPDTYEYGIPHYYYLLKPHDSGGITIGTIPIIGSTDHTLKVYAYMWPTSELSDNDDEPEIRDAYRDALAFYAAHRMFRKYSHRNPKWKARADEMFQMYMDYVNDFEQHQVNDDQFPDTVDMYG